MPNPLTTKIQEIENRFNRVHGAMMSLESVAFEEEHKLYKINDEIAFVENCLQVFEVLIEIKKEEIKTKVEQLVTKGLRTIFQNESYRFEIQMEQKRDTMQARPMLWSNFNGQEMCNDLLDSHGGGIVDVTAFILQIIVLLSIRPQLQKVIVMDEAFRCVSADYISNVADFLKYLNQLTGIQFIFVTHEEEFKSIADKIYRVTQNDKSETIIKEVCGNTAGAS